MIWIQYISLGWGWCVSSVVGLPSREGRLQSFSPWVYVSQHKDLNTFLAEVLVETKSHHLPFWMHGMFRPQRKTFPDRKPQMVRYVSQHMKSLEMADYVLSCLYQGSDLGCVCGTPHLELGRISVRSQFEGFIQNNLEWRMKWTTRKWSVLNIILFVLQPSGVLVHWAVH